MLAAESKKYEAYIKYNLTFLKFRETLLSVGKKLVRTMR